MLIHWTVPLTLFRCKIIDSTKTPHLHCLHHWPSGMTEWLNTSFSYILFNSALLFLQYFKQEHCWWSLLFASTFKTVSTQFTNVCWLIYLSSSLFKSEIKLICCSITFDCSHLDFTVLYGRNFWISSHICPHLLIINESLNIIYIAVWIDISQLPLQWGVGNVVNSEK